MLAWTRPERVSLCEAVRPGKGAVTPGFSCLLIFTTSRPSPGIPDTDMVTCIEGGVPFKCALERVSVVCFTIFL